MLFRSTEQVGLHIGAHAAMDRRKTRHCRHDKRRDTQSGRPGYGGRMICHEEDQQEAEEVTMKVYLHKIILKNNLFSSTGFPLSGSGSAGSAGSAITRRIEDQVEMVQSRAIT